MDQPWDHSFIHCRLVFQNEQVFFGHSDVCYHVTFVTCWHAMTCIIYVVRKETKRKDPKIALGPSRWDIAYRRDHALLSGELSLSSFGHAMSPWRTEQPKCRPIYIIRNHILVASRGTRLPAFRPSFQHKACSSRWHRNCFPNHRPSSDGKPWGLPWTAMDCHCFRPWRPEPSSLPGSNAHCSYWA